MARTKFVAPKPHPEARNPEARKKWRRFRVNDEEGKQVDELARQAGFDNTSEYLRSLLGLPNILRGAPKGNKNKTGKAGANQYSKK
jgi:hypothetical protein